MYKTLLFDLDGTITDSAPGITNSVSYALSKVGIHVSDKNELRHFVGPPLIDEFRKSYGFSEDEARQLVAFYREYYTVKGIFENNVYRGIPELLGALQKSGRKIILATSKPEVYAKKILEHFGLAKYFDFIAGASLDETRTKKDEVISYALDKTGTEDIKTTVMIGDREHDVLGAGKFGMDSIGVLYGYGDLAELSAAGATHIAETAEDILRFI